MKNKIILTFFLFLILIIGITTSSYAMFVIEDFTIDSELKDNGDLYVTERITYCTNEYVNGLTRKIITKNPRNTKNSADSLELNYVKVDGEGHVDLEEVTVETGADCSSGDVACKIPNLRMDDDDLY